MKGKRIAGLVLALGACCAAYSVVADASTDGKTSLTAGFNGTAIPAGSYIWFNSVLKPTFPTGTSQPVTLFLTDATLVLTPKGGTPATYRVPDARITYSPATTKATTWYDAGAFVTTVPASFGDNVFLTGLTVPCPNGLAGGATATFSGTFYTDTLGVKFQYKFAAAVYKTFSLDYNALGIKPTHGGPDDYPGGDQAGTPESFAHLSKNVIGGGTGGGSSNYTGSYSATVSVVPPLAPPPPPTAVSVSGNVSCADSAADAIPGARVELLQGDNAVQSTQTDQNGAYSFTGVPAGTYAVRASAPEHTPQASDVFTVSGTNLTLPSLPLTPLPIAFLSDSGLRGRVFFSGTYADRATTGTTLTDAENCFDLRNPAYASPDLGTAYRYIGTIPYFPELGHFGGSGEPEIYVIIQEPLLPDHVYRTSFSNQVAVFGTPGTGAVGSAGEYTSRFLLSMAFTGPGTAHAYTLTNVQFTMPDGSTRFGEILTQLGTVPSDGSLASPPPSGDVPPGFMAQALGQIALPPMTPAEGSVSGSYADVCGEIFPFYIGIITPAAPFPTLDIGES